MHVAPAHGVAPLCCVWTGMAGRPVRLLPLPHQCPHYPRLCVGPGKASIRGMKRKMHAHPPLCPHPNPSQLGDNSCT